MSESDVYALDHVIKLNTSKVSLFKFASHILSGQIYSVDVAWSHCTVYCSPKQPLEFCHIVKHILALFIKPRPNHTWTIRRCGSYKCQKGKDRGKYHINLGNKIGWKFLQKKEKLQKTNVLSWGTLYKVKITFILW